MKILQEYRRCQRLIELIISRLALDLQGITVLTETGSGAFVLTPLIAALAGAESVIAVTRDSRYASGKDVKNYTEQWAEKMGVSESIEISFLAPVNHAPSADLVTNLGFVRPLNADFLSRLPLHSVVSLMWEPWEYRSSDLDLEYCRQHGIPVLGTDEQDERLQIFKYVGMLAVKLLLEANIEVLRSNVLVIGAGIFGYEVQLAIEQNGGVATVYDPTVASSPDQPTLAESIAEFDAIVVVENTTSKELIGPHGVVSSACFPEAMPLIHLCGNINDIELEKNKIQKIPARKVPPHYMTVTTDYLGPRPVIDLHAAGLKVGESLVRGMRQFGDAELAIPFALENSPALDFNS